jgi:kynurenine formamidase
MNAYTLSIDLPAHGPLQGGRFQLGAGRSLAPGMRLDGSAPRWFDAPPAHSWPHRVGGFSGSVLTGASCNCRNLQLTPHASGTHTESVGHLTSDDFPVLPLLPTTPQPALLLRVAARLSSDTTESSDFQPLPDERLVTAAALRAAWPRNAPFKPVALIIALQQPTNGGMPPYLSRECAQWLVTEDIMHLVVEQPSIDRLQDDGQLTAHRVFFGLPPRRTATAPPLSHSATRAQATITELAAIDADIASGFGFLQIQAPAIDGDAIPTRPIWHAVTGPMAS